MWKDKDVMSSEPVRTNEAVRTNDVVRTNEAVRANEPVRNNEPVRGNIASYREAVEEFSTGAGDFLKCLPILTKTREAYERAMSISSEVRKVLDTGDETLRRMMAQIEDAVHAQIGNRFEKKRPEIVKMEANRIEEDSPKILP